MENNKQPDSQGALRRLLIVLVVVTGFVIYSYGWTVTQINLERPQEEQRQENLQSALRELLSPNIFDQDREVFNIHANFRVGCVEGEAVNQPTDQYEGTLVSITPDCGDPGDIIEIRVQDFSPLAEGRIRWDPPNEESQSRPRELLETGREEFVFGADGSFSGSIEVPLIRGSEGELSQITIRAAIPVGAVRLSNTSQQVMKRMAETIFMALVATTVAIPIAALISFLGAQNLMRPIKLSLGSTLIAFIGMAVGLWLGSWLLKPVADLGVTIGRGNESGAWLAFIVPIGVIVLTVILSRFLLRNRAVGKNTPPAFNEQVISALVRIGGALVVVFLIGSLGGLGLLGSEQMSNLSETIRSDGVVATLAADSILAISNLLRVLSELVELFTVLVGALVGGFVLSGIVTDLFASPLRRVPLTLGHILGGVFGLVSGLILMGFIGQIGTGAALLGLLSPIVAALIGGQIPVLIYNRFVEPQINSGAKRGFTVSQSIRLGLFMVGAVIVFIFTFNYLNIGRAIIDGTLPPQTIQTFLGIEVVSYVFDNMLVGAVLGGITGALAGVHAAFPLGSILYNVARTLLNTVRSIEPLIMGLVFVIWVGIGPFAGVLALTLHSIAALGKLYSEQVENIDEGPVEALDSTGASRLQTIIYAVVPQVIPPYIAFTMYRWDINVRMSTIIGFVGGGGIGLLLQQQINLLRYREAGVAVLAIAVVVSILDYASASIRNRIG